MARRPTPKPTGTLLPAGWRSPWARIDLMMARVPQEEYETAIAAFEAEQRRTRALSEDWPATFKTWCKAEAHRRWQARRAAEAMPAVGMFG